MHWARGGSMRFTRRSGCRPRGLGACAAGWQLRVRWEASGGDGSERTLRVDWRESAVRGMSHSDTPAGSGYGRELVERALPYQLGARTTYAVEADGIHCTIEVAVPDEYVAMEKVDG